MKKGFSTIELMIAMAIIVLVLSATVIVSFGNQSFLSSSEASGEAINKAEGILELEQSKARKDFNLINPIAQATDGIYSESVAVSTLPDFTTKKVTAHVAWQSDTLMNQYVDLTTLIANFENPYSNATCDSTLTGDWSKPQIKNTLMDLPSLANISGTYPITDIDAYQGKLYVTTNNSSANQPTFFIFDIPSLINNLRNPLVTKIDNDALHNSGINALAVSGNYAYVANASGISVGQLQIINLSTLAIKNFKIPGVTQGVGNSIYYKNGYIYLGLVSTGGHGSEFHIIDVHDPANPVEVSNWPAGNLSLMHDINKILVDDQYAYLATPDDTEELIAVSIDDTNQAYSFNAPGGSVSTGNGKSLYKVGDTLYLGRTGITNNPEFYILDDSNPSSIQSLNLSPFTYEAGASLNGVLVRDYLTFLLTNNQLKILNISNPSLITNVSALSLPGASSSGGSSLDCEGNYLFAATKSNGGIYVISPAP